METPFNKKFMRVPQIPLMNVFREIGRNAFVDWIFVLIVSGVVGGLLISGGVHLYWKITTGNFKSTDSSVISEKVFDQDDLTSIINHYNMREDMSTQIRKGYKGPLDPSL